MAKCPVCSKIVRKCCRAFEYVITAGSGVISNVLFFRLSNLMCFRSQMTCGYANAALVMFFHLMI